MATRKQTQAAKKNVRKAAKAAEQKRSLANMPKATKTALGKQGAAVAQRKRTGAKARRPGRSSTRRPSAATFKGRPRWAATSWPARWVTASRSEQRDRTHSPGGTVPTARDIMSKNAECAHPSDTLADVARKMRDHAVGALPICGSDDKLRA